MQRVRKLNETRLPQIISPLSHRGIDTVVNFLNLFKKVYISSGTIIARKEQKSFGCGCLLLEREVIIMVEYLEYLVVNLR